MVKHLCLLKSAKTAKVLTYTVLGVKSLYVTLKMKTLKCAVIYWQLAGCGQGRLQFAKDDNSCKLHYVKKV